MNQGSLTVCEESMAVRYIQGERQATFLAASSLEGYTCVQQAIAMDGSTAVVRRELRRGDHTVHVCDALAPGDGYLRWETRIESDRRDWDAPLHAILRLQTAPRYRFWAPWANGPGGTGRRTILAADAGAEDVAVEAAAWCDPLQTADMTEALWYYGAPYYTEEEPNLQYCPFYDNIVCMPLYSVFWGDGGLSVIQSLEDVMLDATLETSAAGEVSYTRYHHRFGTTAVFHAKIRLHGPDWRSGLGWFCQENRAYVEPVDPLAYEVSGGGAYSASDTLSDVETLKAMGFRVNWKASFDFPYMGMFLPPVEREEEWLDFKGERTSIRRMQRYFEEMKRRGLYGLNYFNVTEFGSGVVYPFPAVKTTEATRWQSANDMLSQELAGAVLLSPRDVRDKAGTVIAAQDRPYGTWGGAVAMDPGEDRYRDFLIQQAREHVRHFPDSYGICIDRLDWLRLYNSRRDDGVSMVDGKKQASLYRSWNRIMDDLSAVFHAHHKLIYCNNHVKRIDLLKEIDGQFDEFTYAGTALNQTGLLGVCMPAIGWVGNKEQVLQAGKDVFMQRFLYMGVHPVVPIRGNDHAIAPDAEIERLYLDYGPLFNRLRGRRWVLVPDCITVEGARGNIFQLPDGTYMVVLVLGGEQAEVRLEHVPLAGRMLSVLYPGAAAPVRRGRVGATDGPLRVTIPLRRGCAMLLYPPETTHAASVHVQP